MRKLYSQQTVSSAVKHKKRGQIELGSVKKLPSLLKDTK